MTSAPSHPSRSLLLATDSKHSIFAELAGGRANSVAYSAYGHRFALHAVMTGVGFNGEIHEGKTGWYFLGNGYRAYNPRLMRFHTPDSWSPFGAGGLNAYMYCGGEPVMGSDSSGHFNPSKWWGNITKFFTAIRDRPALTQPSPSPSTSTLAPDNSPPPRYRAWDPQPSAPSPYSGRAAPPPYSDLTAPPSYWKSGPPAPGRNVADNVPIRTVPPQIPTGSHSMRAPANTSLAPIVNRSNKPAPPLAFRVVTGRTGDQRVILNPGRPSRPTERVLPNGVVIGRDGVERVSLGDIQRQLRLN